MSILPRKASPRGLSQQRCEAKRPNVFTFGRCSLNVSLAEDAWASTAELQVTTYRKLTCS